MRSRVFGFIGVLGIAAIAGWCQSSAQTPVASAAKCNLLHDQSNPPDSNSFDTTALATLSEAAKTKLLTSGLPCQENLGAAGTEPLIERLQRGFDFYSWLTFIALNAPASDPNGFETAKPDAPTWWESSENFKPLLDVMLTDGTKPDWKTPVVPPACRAQLKAKPNLMLVKMIEESFNQPFKTGPLIDQRNNYAIFDILMNRSMFDYIVEHKLYSRAGQMSPENTNLRIDFPVGQQKKVDGTGIDDHGAIMIKISWKILDPDEDKSKFHHVQALVAMPSFAGRTSRPAMHRENSRPGRLPCRPQDDRPAAMDLDVVRAHTQCARAERHRCLQKESQSQKETAPVQFLFPLVQRQRLPGQSNAATALGPRVQEPVEIPHHRQGKHFIQQPDRPRASVD